VPEDHERIEALLAGYALLGLSGEDAIEAGRLLDEHVPTCPICRETLWGFRSVVGELALAAPAAPPPDLLMPRIRRGMDDPRPSRRRTGAFVAVAAGVAALVGMASLSMSLGTRAHDAETQRDLAFGLVDYLSQPGSSTSGLDSATTPTHPMVEVSGPSGEVMVVVGRDVPQPGPGSDYVVWLGTASGFRPVHRFTPDPRGGFVFEQFAAPSDANRIVITEERLGPFPVAPAMDSPHVWQASL
jgi:hypothetical protein